MVKNMEAIQAKNVAVMEDSTIKKYILSLAKEGKYGEAALVAKNKLLPSISFMSFDSDDADSWLSNFVCGMTCCNCCEEGSESKCVSAFCIAFCLISCLCGSDKAFEICGINWACDCCGREAGCHS